MTCRDCGGDMALDSVRPHDGYKLRTYICRDCGKRMRTIEVEDNEDIRGFLCIAPAPRTSAWDDERLTYLAGGHVDGGLSFPQLAEDLNCTRDQVYYMYRKLKKSGLMDKYVRKHCDSTDRGPVYRRGRKTGT